MPLVISLINPRTLPVNCFYLTISMAEQPSFVDLSDSMTVARIMSLQLQNADPNAKFHHQRQRVATNHNGGNITIVKDGEHFLRTYVNKCFILSLLDGLRQHNLIQKNYTPFQLMTDFGFDQSMIMFDTARADHRQMITQFLAKYKTITLEFYIGQQEGEQWFTTQTPHATFGTGPHVIRILNMNGNHFEYIIDQEHPPIPQVSEQQQLDAMKRQLLLLQQAEMAKLQKDFEKMTSVTDSTMEPSRVYHEDNYEYVQQPVAVEQPASSAPLVPVGAVTYDNQTVTNPDEKKEEEKKPTDEEIAKMLEQEEQDAKLAEDIYYGRIPGYD